MANSRLPSGTVTFLFTDVEGSTRLLRELGERPYAEALAEHRRVVRKACAVKGGAEVDTQGDAFFFAFASAPEAVAAARAITDALAPGPIHLRIGLHTGTPLLTDEGYVGNDVHFAARVAASAHGGQVVLSNATREFVDGLSLADLGEHRLKDIEGAVSIYQLGEKSFPPLRTISNTNLPRPASSFVGRAREVEDVLSQLREGTRLLTLTGPGGSGKTRLAIEAASVLVPDFRNGVFWVGLATLRDPVLVTAAVAQTLGARDGLADFVGEREMLLLLDNFEQVVEAAPQLGSLLEACPHLSVLVTSRELLRVRGEVEYAVPPLAEPEAVELFCTRSRLVTDRTVVELCRRLDNLPLAVELAAARTSVLSPAQILDRLCQRLDLLKGGRDAETRQQTLRATIEWSYDLLSLEEQRLFARLAVFAGGCTLEAAEEVAEADLDTLQSLVDKSLVRHSDERFWMLETIREYARGRLEELGEDEELRRRHAAYFLEQFDAPGDALRRRRERLGRFISVVRGEQANARQALAWYQDTGDADRKARLAASLHPLWMASPAEGRRVLDETLTETGLPDDVRGRVLWTGWMVAGAQGDFASAKGFLEKGLPLYARVGDRWSLAEALRTLGSLELREGDTRRGRELLSESERIAVDLGDRRLLAAASKARAYIPLYQGDYDRARLAFEDALHQFREADDVIDAKFVLTSLGLVALEQGRLTDAASLFRESLSIRVEFTRSSADDAIDGCAAIAIARGDAPTAARLLGATGEWRRAVGYRQDSFESAIRDRTAAAARKTLGEEVYRDLAKGGAQLDLNEAIDVALATLE